MSITQLLSKRFSRIRKLRQMSLDDVAKSFGMSLNDFIGEESSSNESLTGDEQALMGAYRNNQYGILLRYIASRVEEDT